MASGGRCLSRPLGWVVCRPSRVATERSCSENSKQDARAGPLFVHDALDLRRGQVRHLVVALVVP